MTARLSPREKRQEKTRQAILNTAMEIIVEKGVNNLSLREIARRIDYSPAGLYEYFDSKDDIVDAVCDEGNERLYYALKAVANTLPTREYLVEIGLAYIRFARQNPEHFIFLFTFRQPDSESMSTLDPKELDSEDSFLILYNAVESGIESGVIQTSEGFGAMEIVYSLWAFVHGLAMLQIKYLRDLSIDFEIADRQAISLYVEGLAQSAQLSQT